MLVKLHNIFKYTIIFIWQLNFFLQASFTLPEGVDFITHFTEALSQFKTAVENYPAQKLTYLVSDPSTKKVEV